MLVTAGRMGSCSPQRASQALLLVALALTSVLAVHADARSQDQLVGRQIADSVSGQIGRRLQQSTASSYGSGGSVQTSTSTTGPNGQTTTSGQDLTAPPGGTVTSSVGSSAPTSPGTAKPIPTVAVPAPKPPPPRPPPPVPPCTDIPPPLNGFSCAQQKYFGKCEASWMLLNGWCKTTCGHCPKKAPPPPSPPPPTPPPPALLPPLTFPPILPLSIPPFTPFPVFPQFPPINTGPVTYGSPCDQSDYQSGSGSVSASASCTSYGKK